MDEFEIIRRFFTRTAGNPGVIVGVGDDGAILRPDPGRDLISVLDTLVAGVHFPEVFSPDDIGYRAVAVNVSDIAAMGGRPRWMTLGLTLHEVDARWLDGFASGLFVAASEYGVDLVGGDMTHGSEVVVSVQITGDIEAGKALKRGGAMPGHGIYVSGTPGDAAAGLALLQSNAPRSEAADQLVWRFRRPLARVELGQSLCGSASAAIDVSDGLFTDLEKLLAASGVAGAIEVDNLPLSSELTELMDRDDAIRFALSGGDDYELCFTGPDEKMAEVALRSGVKVTRIGEIGEGHGLACIRGGKHYHYDDTGYRHFS
ncbi:MAG: thiamine-phosphate kinase [Gammaproteobacteria bacterium]|nr:thiamine-phosphate kinase [Gammaproteobacteria bacterium]